MTVITSDTQAK